MSDHLICQNCENQINPDFEFCPFCGTIFIEDVQCNNHPDENAEGVCLICETAFCSNCGIFVNDKFLCEVHSDYEIYQGMVRVFGSSDQLEVEYMEKVLKLEELHSFIYSRKTSPISIGGTDYTLFRASGEHLGQIINEIKLMVPLNEVLKAEEIISGL